MYVTQVVFYSTVPKTTFHFKYIPGEDDRYEFIGDANIPVYISNPCGQITLKNSNIARYAREEENMFRYNFLPFRQFIGRQQPSFTDCSNSLKIVNSTMHSDMNVNLEEFISINSNFLGIIDSKITQVQIYNSNLNLLVVRTLSNSPHIRIFNTTIKFLYFDKANSVSISQSRIHHLRMLENIDEEMTSVHSYGVPMRGSISNTFITQFENHTCILQKDVYFKISNVSIAKYLGIIKISDGASLLMENVDIKSMNKLGFIVEGDGLIEFKNVSINGTPMKATSDVIRFNTPYKHQYDMTVQECPENCTLKYFTVSISCIV